MIKARLFRGRIQSRNSINKSKHFLYNIWISSCLTILSSLQRIVVVNILVSYLKKLAFVFLFHLLFDIEQVTEDKIFEYMKLNLEKIRRFKSSCILKMWRANIFTALKICSLGIYSAEESDSCPWIHQV